MYKNKTQKNIIFDNLICSYCNNLLLFDNGLLKCMNNSCSKYNLHTLFLNQKPVLINFNDSIINEAALKKSNGISVVKRPYKNYHKTIKSFFQKKSKISNSNVSTIIDFLKVIKSPRILIVGGGEIGSSLDMLYHMYNENIISFDIYESPIIDFIADAHNIPVKSEYFDLVICQAVLEHVISPSRVVDEIFRVLKVDGLVYAETPFMQQVHEGPFDFTRYSESGHRYLFKNFKNIKSGYTTGSGTALIWSLSYFFTGLFRSKIAGRTIRVLFFWLTYFDNIIPHTYNIDAACGVFFLGRKSVDIISNSEIISHYSGSQK
jgi:SAM-dependent methyltransferase